MKIQSIRFKNLNSLEGENVVDFTASPISDTGLFAITGDTGAGKSTILDAITLSLYGKVHRNKNVIEVMTYGTASSFAETVFEVGQDVYMCQWTIWRARNKPDGNMQGPVRKLSLKNKVSGEFEIIAEKIRDVDDKVDEVTGLDYDRFCRSVLLSQGDFAAFLKASEKDRSILLERITGTEIYSQISKAAYEKNKEEEHQLELIQQQLSSLDILSDDELDDLKSELAEHQTLLAGTQEQFKEKQVALQALEKIDELQKNLNQTHNELADWSIQKEKIQPELDRLDIHLKTRHLHDKILDRKRMLRDSHSTLDDIFQINELIQQKNIEMSLQEKAFTKAKGIYQSLKNQEQELNHVLDQVTQLDSEIKTRKEALTPKQEEWKKIKKQLDLKEKERNELKNEFESSTQHYKDLNQWLETHKTDEFLAEDLPQIEFPLGQLMELSQSKLILDKEYVLVKNKEDKIKGILEKVKKNISVQKKSNQQLKEKYISLDPDDNSYNGIQLNRQLQKEIEELGQMQNDLRQLSDLNRDYKKAMKEMDEYESEWDNLENEEYIRIRALLSREDELSSLKQKLDYKKGIYEQQKALKDYELERNNLAEGNPCPLCLSTEHPFRHQHFEPRPDLAKEELEIVEKQFDQFERLYEKERLSLEKIADRKSFLQGDGKEIAGQISRTSDRMLEYEDKIAKVIKSLAEEGLTLLDTGVILDKIRDIQQQIEFKKKVQQQILKLSEKINRSEKELDQLDDQLKEQQFNYSRNGDEFKRLREEINEKSSHIEKLRSTLDVYFKKYNLNFDSNNHTLIKSNLKSRKEAFISKKKNSEQLREELNIQKKEIENIEEINSELKKRISLIEEDGKKEREAINLLEQQRNTLLPKEIQPQEKRTNFISELNQAEENNQQLKKVIDHIQKWVVGQKSIVEEKEKNRTQLLEQLSLIEQPLQQYVEKENIQSVDILESSILDAPSLQKIEKAEKELNDQFTRLKQKESDQEKQLEQLQDQTDEDWDIKIIRKETQDLEVSINSIKENIGRFKERMDSNEEKKKNSKSLSKTLDKQKRECLRWSKLNELIGQHDGKKFRVFAQGLTLRRLTHLANLHLRSLNERYQIHKPTDKDLELEIIDTYQANHSRSVNTLSGGESFLVSLALALGLSDLAGRNTQIGSLFIDEGFGTLDNDTLEVALQTLEKLQHTGKTIGVISHIQQLKERINIQIQVSKKGNGYSQIRVIS